MCPPWRVWPSTANAEFQPCPNAHTLRQRKKSLCSVSPKGNICFFLFIVREREWREAGKEGSWAYQLIGVSMRAESVLRGPLCTHATRRKYGLEWTMTIAALFISQYLLSRIALHYFKSANETVSNAKTEQDVFQMGQVEEDVYIKGCTMSFIVCSCSFY